MANLRNINVKKNTFIILKFLILPFQKVNS